VVTYGSPSAVKAWLALAGLDMVNSKVGRSWLLCTAA
jgi:hypothetical protein